MKAWTPLQTAKSIKSQKKPLCTTWTSNGRGNINFSSFDTTQKTNDKTIVNRRYASFQRSNISTEEPKKSRQKKGKQIFQVQARQKQNLKVLKQKIKRTFGKKQTKLKFIKEKKVNNRQLLTNSVYKHPAMLLLTKIATVFDLVLQGIEVPNEVTSIFGNQIKTLQLELNKSGLNKVGELLTAFKNDTYETWKKACKKAAQNFLYCILPVASRWTAFAKDKFSLLNNKIKESRLYFKEKQINRRKLCTSALRDSTLERIEQKIQQYIQRNKLYNISQEK